MKISIKELRESLDKLLRTRITAGNVKKRTNAPPTPGPNTNSIRHKGTQGFKIGDMVFNVDHVGDQYANPFPTIWQISNKTISNRHITLSAHSTHALTREKTIRHPSDYRPVSELTTSYILSKMQWLEPDELENIKRTLSFKLRNHLIKYKVISSMSKLPEEQ